jgi:hypothetical protein
VCRFGEAGTPLWSGLARLGLSKAELRGVGWRGQLLLLPCVHVVPLLAASIVIPWRGLRASWRFVLVSLWAPLVPALALAFVSTDLSSLVGGLLALLTVGTLSHFKFGLNAHCGHRRGHPEAPVENGEYPCRGGAASLQHKLDVHGGADAPLGQHGMTRLNELYDMHTGPLSPPGAATGQAALVFPYHRMGSISGTGIVRGTPPGLSEFPGSPQGVAHKRQGRSPHEDAAESPTRIRMHRPRPVNACAAAARPAAAESVDAAGSRTHGGVPADTGADVAEPAAARACASVDAAGACMRGGPAVDAAGVPQRPVDAPAGESVDAASACTHGMAAVDVEGKLQSLSAWARASRGRAGSEGIEAPLPPQAAPLASTGSCAIAESKEGHSTSRYFSPVQSPVQTLGHPASVVVQLPTVAWLSSVDGHTMRIQGPPVSGKRPTACIHASDASCSFPCVVTEEAQALPHMAVPVGEAKERVLPPAHTGDSFLSSKVLSARTERRALLDDLASFAASAPLRRQRHSRSAHTPVAATASLAARSRLTPPESPVKGTASTEILLERAQTAARNLSLMHSERASSNESDMTGTGTGGRIFGAGHECATHMLDPPLQLLKGSPHGGKAPQPWPLPWEVGVRPGARGRVATAKEADAPVVADDAYKKLQDNLPRLEQSPSKKGRHSVMKTCAVATAPKELKTSAADVFMELQRDPPILAGLPSKKGVCP